MGSKKKSGGGKHQQEKDHANGNPLKTSHSPPPERKLPPNSSAKGKPSRQKKDPSPPSSLSESRLPWRLILLFGIVAGGVAVICVNEPVKSVLEDFYVSHLETHVLHRFASILQVLKQSPTPDKGEDQPSQQTQHPHTDSKPAPPPSGDRQKRESPPSTTPSPPPPTPAPKTEAKDTKKDSDSKPDKSAPKTPEKKVTDKPAETPKDRSDTSKTQTDESKRTEKEAAPKEKPVKDSASTSDKPDQKTDSKTKVEEPKKDQQKPTPQKEAPHTVEKTQEKTPQVDPPTPDPKTKQDTPSEPVVEEIKVKTTPKSDKKTPDTPTQKPEIPAEKTQKPAEKPVPKTAEKNDSKPAEKSDGKPSDKSSQKPDSKDNATERPKDDYPKAAITNKADSLIVDKLDEADELLENEQYEDALRKYDSIVHKYPNSPRAQLGRADSLDKLAFKKRSNEVLEQSITAYSQLIYHGVDVPPEMVKMAGRTLAKKQQFRGWRAKAAETLQFLVDKFPDDLSLQREQGVSFLMVGQNEEARIVFKNMLKKHPNDGFAQVHLGFILKTTDNNPMKAIPLLLSGIDSKEEGTQDGRFFFHLGDAYQRLEQTEEARKIYQRGADIGVFLSADQRSLYNVNTLKSQPWWTREQSGYENSLKLLEDNWKTIRDEGLKQLDSDSGLFKPEAESLRERGDWQQLTMYQQGHKNRKVCDKVPKTCALIDEIPAAKLCKRGQVKFSVMSPGVHVWPHCGPTNCRIRAHLGLVVPEGPRIRVVNETRTWQEGKFLIFDDSFEHEVWHDGTSLRLVLIVDFWHPDLTEEEKRTLVPI